MLRSSFSSASFSKLPELLPEFCRRSKELKSDPGSPVPWFARHVEILGDVIIYPVLVVARTETSSLTVNS